MQAAKHHLATERVVLRLLEGFEVTCRDRPVLLPRGCERLVAFVALFHRPLRCVVTGKLWPEKSERCAQASLRTDLHRLRGACDTTIVETSRGHLTLSAQVEVDVRQQVRALDALESSQPTAPGRAVIDQLRGELLPGWYEDWLFFEREQLRTRRLHALEALSAAFSHDGHYAAAIEAALAALAVDPLRETAHRALVEVHLAEGNRAEAMRQWRLYRRLIRDRFGIEPSFSWEEIAARGHETLSAA